MTDGQINNFLVVLKPGDSPKRFLAIDNSQFGRVEYRDGIWLLFSRRDYEHLQSWINLGQFKRVLAQWH